MIPPLAGDPGPTDGGAMDEVVDAIFRMFDGHIDAVAHAWEPVPPPASVALVGAPTTLGDGAAFPHG